MKISPPLSSHTFPQKPRAPITNAPSQHHLHAVSSCFSIEILWNHVIRQKALLGICSEWHLQLFSSVRGKKEELEQAVMQSKLFIYFTSIFMKITSLMFCDSNFLYRVIFNMALQERFTKTAISSIRVIQHSFLPLVWLNIQLNLSNLGQFIHSWCRNEQKYFPFCWNISPCLQRLRAREESVTKDT